jgi:hypothetical protein
VGDADPIAASAQAARDILIAQYPTAAAEIDALLVEHLALSPNASCKALGARIGAAAAESLLALRREDGWDVEGTYAFSTEPGAYQTTPDWRGFVVQPGLARAKPSFLPSPTHFRPSGPPHLQSRAYARAFKEVKERGSLTSTLRTEDQTAYAVWWMEFSEGLVNRYARRLATERKLDLWQAARLFALMNAALADAYVAVWDSKYEFNHWRPYTAIRDAARDENPLTQPDPKWESLRPAPPFPEYVSAHAAGCAATFAVLQHELAGLTSVTLDSLAAPPSMPTRSFHSLSAAANECADSRVYLGFHFRYSTDAGRILGRRVARYAMRHYLRARQ